MTVFEIAKEKISMENVLESYRITVDRGGMCLCPFHSERHASCKVYTDHMHCFDCGVHLDAVRFVKKYFGLASQYEALKKLNSDFSLGLGLALDKPADNNEKSAYLKHTTEKNAYDKWERSVWKTLNSWFRTLTDYLSSALPPRGMQDMTEKYITAQS